MVSVRGTLVLALLSAFPACKKSPAKDPPFQGSVATILFATQVPHAGFTTVSSSFGNHRATMSSAPRGGDLMIRYPDGTLRNLTREAGFGSGGLQGENAIAVREPSVHFSGTKGVFSMVVGAPRQFETKAYRWQLYEVTGLGPSDAAVVTKVPNQPEQFNNVAPLYGTNDRILFVSDRPRQGEMHLYPQLDEYESAPTNTGLWSLDPGSGDLFLVNHAPSGVFSPSLDSFGRVVFTKWDHLQRDQQADADRGTPTYGSFTYADESAGASKIASLQGMEVFPEPRDEGDPDRVATLNLHRFNQFIPWEINEDGTAEETLNHVGRHELGGTFIEGSFVGDDNLTYLVPESTHANRFYIRGDGGLFHLREDPMTPGMFLTTYAPEFATASGGVLLKLEGAPSVNPEEMRLTPLTDPDGSDGHFRNPLPMSNGSLVAAHTRETGEATNLGNRASPRWNYDYRLKVLQDQGGRFAVAGALTAGIEVDIRWFDPDVMVTYKGPLWELDPVEVRARPRPTPRTSVLDEPERAAIAAEGANEAALREWLRTNDLALIVSRNVTHRDRADVQQPFNLRVVGGVSTTPKSGTVYDVAYFQVFQGDALRGYGGVDDPNPGRRLLARPIHGPSLPAPPAGGPAGSVAVASDGSIAAFVPARRALTWQLTAPDGTPVVRERNWISFQPGEIRACPSCHGVNRMNQAGAPQAQTQPQALRELVRSWLARQP